MVQVDVFIAGGGLAGLVAAARLSADGHSVALADPSALKPGGGTDTRTTAFLWPSIDTLRRAQVWQSIQSAAAPLRVMRIIDAGGRERHERTVADFDGAELGHDGFGWNVDNLHARNVLLTVLNDRPNVTLLDSSAVRAVVPRLKSAIVQLTNGFSVTAKLVIGADGRQSVVRETLDVEKRRWTYGQSALVFAVNHSLPHEDTSTEIHRTGGPLTLVPMPDRNGLPCSSVVWMTPHERAMDLAAMTDRDMAAELEIETMGRFGALTVVGPRSRWPIITQIATRMIADRTALIAEAAHVMPPIGAQGLNTSLHDVETLAVLIEHAEDPGAPSLLAGFERKVLPNTLSRLAGVDVLNRAAMAEHQTLRDIRRVGLEALNRIDPLRSLAMRTGLGV